MQILNRILSRLEVAAPKSSDAYQWFVYSGAKDIPISGRTPIVISKGTTFGVRPSSNGKLIRLVLQGQETKVYTIDLATAKQLAKYCSPLSAAKKAKPAATPKTASGKDFRSFNISKIYAVVKPFWDKKYKRTDNSIGYHGTDAVTADKIVKAGKFSAGSYFTSNPIDAMFWALMAADDKHVGATVLMVDLSAHTLAFGDQADNLNHCKVKQPVAVKAIAFHEAPEGVKALVKKI